MPTTWTLILTSAAIGAAVSAAITILGTLLAQIFERRARRQELFLSKAIELARWKNERVFQVASHARRGKFQIDDEIFLVRAFFDDLKTLFASGKLSPNSEQHYETSVRPSREAPLPWIKPEE